MKMARSYYGRRRVDVLPHEALLKHETFMEGAIEWVKRFKDTEIPSCIIRFCSKMSCS